MTEENTAPEANVQEDMKAQAEAVKASGVNEADMEAQGDKILSAVGYFSFLCILPLVVRPESKFCQFHGKQGLAITIIFLAFSVVAWLPGFWMPGIYGLLGLLQFLVALLGVLSAFQGKMNRIPFVSQIADKLDW